MSLKARIEAVIYAAEEPVTLPQLAALFRDEALASRAARVAAVSGDPDAPTEAEVAAEPVLSDLVSSPDAASEVAPSEPAAQNSADAEVATPDFAGEPQPVPEPPGPAANGTPAEAASEAAAAEPEALAAQRAAARQRDREVRDEIRAIVDELIADYNGPDRGLEIREVAGGFRFGTRPEYHDAVRAFVKSLKPPMKLSLQALETLAVIAYKQPVTAPEIGDIRGVDSGGVLGSLVARKLITTAGRKQVIGRPILYKTTKEFLLRFGLKDLNELPSIEEFEKMASELAETDSAEPEEENAPAPAEGELPFAEDEAVEQAADEVRAEETAESPAEEVRDSASMNATTETPSEPDLAPTSEHDASASVEEQS